MQASPLLESGVTPSFRGAVRCAGLAIVLTRPIEALLRRLGVTCRTFPSQRRPYAGLDHADASIVSVALKFLLCPSAPDFAVITDLSAIAARQSRRFVNLENAVGNPVCLKLTARSVRWPETFTIEEPQGETKCARAARPQPAGTVEDLAISARGMPTSAIAIVKLSDNPRWLVMNTLEANPARKLRLAIRHVPIVHTARSPRWNCGRLRSGSPPQPRRAASVRGNQSPLRLLHRDRFAEHATCWLAPNRAGRQRPIAEAFRTAGRATVTEVETAADSAAADLKQRYSGRRVLRFLSSRYGRTPGARSNLCAYSNQGIAECH